MASDWWWYVPAPTQVTTGAVKVARLVECFGLAGPVADVAVDGECALCGGARTVSGHPAHDRQDLVGVGLAEPVVVLTGRLDGLPGCSQAPGLGCRG